MDRDISIQESRKQKGRVGRYVVLSAIVLIAAIWLLRGALSASLKRADIRIAAVETGDVENTLNASGEVQPEMEQVITSPISAIIQQAYFNAGSKVKPGDKILELDKTFTRIEFEKQKDQLELKRNGIVRIRLDLDKSYFDIQIQDSIKAYEINSLKAELENAKRLFKAGGGTREAIEQAETNLRIAQLQKRQLENDIRSRQQSMKTSIRESEISAAIQEKELSEFERKLRQADIVATRAGVLTYVNLSLGAKVNEGDILARVADLGSFKVLGSISDTYSPQLRAGMPVIVRIGDELVRGTLVNIHPAVSNNVVTFDVALDDQRASKQLRPRMKVELFLVTEAKPRTVRVQNGPAFKGGAVQDVFVLRGGKAERRTIHVGLSNFDFVEITEGLQPGDSVIITDMSGYRNIKSIDIR